MKLITTYLGRARRSRRSKRGFTIVELSVVLALLAIITGMTVTFSVLTHEFAAENTRKYDFLQDCAVIEKEITEWAAENSNAETVFTITQDGKNLMISNTYNGKAEIQNAYIDKDGAFHVGSERLSGVGTVYRVKFEFNNAKTLIKCTLFMGEGDDSFSSSFVFAPRVKTSIEKESP